MKFIKHIALWILILFSVCSVYSQNDKISNVQLENLQPIDRIEVLNRLAETFSEDSLEHGLKYLVIAYEESLNIDSIELSIRQAEKIGDVYTQIGKYNQAIEYYNYALNFAAETNDSNNFSRIYRLMGNAYYYLGEYDKSLESHMESLKYAKENRDEGSIAAAYNNIGLINMRYEKFDLALENYQKAEKIFAKLGNLSNQGMAIINIGNIHYFSHEVEAALEQYVKAYKIFKQTDNLGDIALAAQNISAIYDLKNDNEKAMLYAEEALALYQKVSNTWGISRMAVNVGFMFLDEDNFQKALFYFNMAHDNASLTNSLPLQISSYYALIEFYEKQGNFEQAFKMLNEQNTLVDSLNSKETNEKIADLESKYQLEQAEKEYGIIRKYLIYISILSLLVVVVLLFNYRLKVQSNKQLREKNVFIEQQNKKLEEINATKDKFFSIIAHDLKNPLAAFIGFIDIIQERLAELPKEEIRDNLTQVSHLAENMLDLLENLLKWGRSQEGSIEFKPENISIAEIMQKTLEIVDANAKSKAINITVENEDNFVFRADRNMILTVLRNLVSNAIKFTHRGEEVHIHASKTDSFVKIFVRDNGIGISADDQKKLFHIDTKIRSHGTEMEPGTGLGLILCKEFVQFHGGEMFFNSEPNVGSTFGFTLPIDK